MLYKLGILDEDTGYVVKLMEYINMLENCLFKAAVFSTAKSLKEYVKSNRFDVLLVGDEFYEELKGFIKDENDKIGVFVSLTNEKEIADDTEIHSETTIYKYQNIDNIIMQLEKLVGARKKEQHRKYKLYAVYSPYGRSGKTSLALGMCNEIDNSLYIGMEEYSGICCGDSIRSAGEKFLYFMVSRNADLFDYVYNENIKNRNQYGDFHLIPGGLNYMDIRTLSVEDLEWFREQLYCDNRYDAAVLDVGTGAMGNIEVLNVADKIAVPIPYNFDGDVKLECFRQTLKRGNMKSISEKMVFIDMPEISYKSERMKDIINQYIL